MTEEQLALIEEYNRNIQLLEKAIQELNKTRLKYENYINKVNENASEQE